MEFVHDFAQFASYFGLGVLIFFLGKLIKDWTTVFDDNKHLVKEDNSALGLSVCGYYPGVITIYMGACLGPALAPGAFTTDAEFYSALISQLIVTFVWSMVGVVCLNAARWSLDKFNLKNFSIENEIIRDRNMGAGAIEFGSYLASALVIASCIHGDSGNWVTAIAYFVVSQVALLLFTKLYQKLTPFNIMEEIEKDNVAAGVALGGNYLGMGLVIAAAAHQPYIGLIDSAIAFSTTVGFGVILLLAARFVADRILLPGECINKEIAEDRNVAAALVEAAAVISFGVLVFALV